MSATSARKKTQALASSGDSLKVVTLKPNLKSIYFTNNGLFAENYLVNRLPAERNDSFVMQHWETDDLPEFSACYEWMLSTWDEYKDILPTLSEAQLEDKWIRPILERLGWAYEVQDRLKRRGKTQIPDYSLFDSPETYKKAKGCTNNEKYFSHVQAVADAKAMGVDLDGKGRSNSNPSYQIVRYMEDTGCQWGILTDGEYWRLYSTRSKSRHTTFYEVNIRKVLSGRGNSPRDDHGFKYFFNFFRRASFADRDAAGKSFLDIVYESGERYAREVETQLKERAFRIVENIAKGFAGTSKNLSNEELRGIYQHSLYYLFRLLFILNCESRGILDVNDFGNYFPHSLRAIAHRLKEEFERNVGWSSRPKVYEELAGLFSMLERGDRAVGVFPFGKDLFESGSRKFFETRKIPDVELNKAIVDLACAYSDDGDLQFIDYGRLGADHIGSIFEGLLEYSLKYAESDLVVDKKGKVHKAKDFDKKPSAVVEKIAQGNLFLSTGSGERKVSGAFYTPEYVVDYIVEETLQPLCENKSADEILDLTVCDPAMGSGHFLLGAVRYLERRVLEKLFETDEKAADIDAGEIRWKILSKCVYGVDVNPIAVELAKFSLWIYSVRPENELEPLSDQLVCADSLLDSRPWDEDFRAVKNRGGFSAVVGNPPYVRQEELKDKKGALKDKYEVFHNMGDLYSYFLELSDRVLCAQGRCGMIISNKWMKADYGLPLRTWLSKKGLQLLVDFGDLPVFPGVAAYPCILVFGKERSSQKAFRAARIDSLEFESLAKHVLKCEYQYPFAELSDDMWNVVPPEVTALLKKIGHGAQGLGEYVDEKVYRGVLTGLTEAFIIDKETGDAFIKQDKRNKELLKPFLLGRDIKRYGPCKAERYLIFIPKGWTNERLGKSTDPWKWLSSNYPAIAAHLAKYRTKAEKRFDKGDYWWELRACDYYGELEQPKIVYLKFQVQPIFTYDESGTYVNDAGFFIPTQDKVLLGILNSRLGWFLISNLCTEIRGGYQLIYKYLKSFPVRGTASSKMRGKFEALVDKKLKEAVGMVSKRGASQASDTDVELDRAVFDLYGLTEEEIALVMKATGAIGANADAAEFEDVA